MTERIFKKKKKMRNEKREFATENPELLKECFTTFKILQQWKTELHLKRSLLGRQREGQWKWDRGKERSK